MPNGPEEKRSMNSRPLKIFLCHSSEDKPAVQALYARLIADGFDVWLDSENLLPGQDWKSEIPKVVRNSDIVVILISKTLLTKEGYIQKEIRVALDAAEEKPEGTIFIIPAKIEECDFPERLRNWQWVNLYDPNGYERLKLALQHRSASLIQNAHPKASARGTSKRSLSTTSKIWMALLTGAACLFVFACGAIGIFLFSQYYKQGNLPAAPGFGPGLKPSNIATLTELNQINMESGFCPSIAFSPRTNILAVMDGNIIKLIDAKSLQELDRQEVTAEYPRRLEYSDFDKSTLVTGDSAGFIHTYDTGRREYGIITTGAVGTFALDPLRLQFATDGFDSQYGTVIKIWDIYTWEEVSYLTWPQDDAMLANGFAYSPDGSKFAGSQPEGYIVIWDVNTGSVKHILDGNESLMGNFSMAFSDDGDFLYSNDDEGNVYKWDVNEGELSFTLKGHTDSVVDMEITSNDLMVVTASSNEVIFWDRQTNELLLSNAISKISDISTSFDSTIVAVASCDGKIRLFGLP